MTLSFPKNSFISHHFIKLHIFKNQFTSIWRMKLPLTVTETEKLSGTYFFANFILIANKTNQL